MKIAFVIPTRNRPERLASTLRVLGALALNPAAAQVIVVDNASSPSVSLSPVLENGVETSVIKLGANAGAAARNVAVGASDPACEWVVMLDDDSHPVDTRWLASLASRPADVAGVMADIHLPHQGMREQGGLPEVCIGCGVAIRRDWYLRVGGYDAAFDYYAEEYDLCARFLLDGGRLAFEPTWRVEHHKVESGRDMNRILHRLARNNGWVAQRYAPETDRRSELRTHRSRYRSIGRKEGATHGVAQGFDELRRTMRAQRRTPMPRELWDRFTGLAHAREALGRAHAERRFATATIVERGKNGHLVERALAELGVNPVEEPESEALVIGTLSPGPMLDAVERWEGKGRRVIAPWECATPRATSSQAA